jgi:hypothetical protein
VITVADWFCPYDDRQREGLSADAATQVVDEAKIAGVSGPSHAMAMGTVATPAVNYPGYNDQDLGSAGGCLIESLGLYLVAGKDGILYATKINNMGKTTLAQLAAGQQYAALAFAPIYFTYFPGFGVSPDPLNPDTLNVMFGGKTRHNHSQPLQFLSSVHGQMVVCAGENSPIRVWTVTATGITFLAQSVDVSSPNVPTGMPGMFMTISANGTTPGTALLYAVAPYNDANQTVSPAHLMIFDLENFAGQTLVKLWDSADWGITFDMCKFTPPEVSGGKILLPTYDDKVLILG